MDLYNFASQYSGALTNTVQAAISGYVSIRLSQSGFTDVQADAVRRAVLSYLQSSGSDWSVLGLMSVIKSAISSVLNAGAGIFGAAADAAATWSKIYAGFQIAGIGLAGYLLYSLLSD